MSVSQPLPGQESLNVKVINILYKNPPYKMYYRYILNEIWVLIYFIEEGFVNLRIAKPGESDLILVFIALSNLRHRSRPNGGRGMEMRHGARRRGVTIAE